MQGTYDWIWSSIAVMALAGAMSAAAAPAADPVRVSVAIDVSRSSEMRFNGHPLPRQGEGMGVATMTHEIATAAHVVWGAERIVITDARGARRAAAIERIDPDADIALLRTDEPLDDVAVMRPTAALARERVGAVQFVARAAIISAGTVWDTRWRSHAVPVPLVLTGIKGRKGMSGGGLFDASGQLLGIIIRIDRRLGYLSALPAIELCRRFGRCAGDGAAAAEAPWVSQRSVRRARE